MSYSAVTTRASAGPLGTSGSGMAVERCLALERGPGSLYLCTHQSLDMGSPGKGAHPCLGSPLHQMENVCLPTLQSARGMSPSKSKGVLGGHHTVLETEWNTLSLEGNQQQMTYYFTLFLKFSIIANSQNIWVFTVGQALGIPR